jgi:hypothetical protein
VPAQSRTVQSATPARSAIANSSRWFSGKFRLLPTPLAEFGKCADCPVETGYRFFKDQWITCDGVLKMIPLAEHIEVRQMRDQFSRTPRPEHNGIHIRPSKRYTPQLTRVEGIRTSTKTARIRFMNQSV